jgi:hypothetical protein
LYKFTCPHCGSQLNPDARKDKPIAGDLLLCMGCATVLIYVDPVTVRAATKEEQEEILHDENVHNLRNVVLRR